MKKSKTRCMILVTITTMLVLFIQLPIFAANTKEKIILKNEDNSYLIYYPDICNKKFEFALSQKSDANISNLNYISSITTKEGLNVAYIDKDLANKYVENNITYLWVKGTDIEASKLDLTNVLDDEKIKEVDNATNKIKTKTDIKEIKKYVDENGTKIAVNTGVLLITEDTNNTYYYQVAKVEEGTRYEELFNMAEKIQEGIDNTYNKLKTTKDFYELLKELQPIANSENWIKTENKEIMQPEDTKENYRYIVWIKAEDKNSATIQDVKFMTSNYKNLPTFEESKVITETVSLPVTYDSIIGIVLFVVVLIAILVLLILKRKSKNKENI